MPPVVAAVPTTTAVTMGARMGVIVMRVADVAAAIAVGVAAETVTAVPMTNPRKAATGKRSADDVDVENQGRGCSAGEWLSGP